MSQINKIAILRLISQYNLVSVRGMWLVEWWVMASILLLAHAPFHKGSIASRFCFPYSLGTVYPTTLQLQYNCQDLFTSFGNNRMALRSFRIKRNDTLSRFLWYSSLVNTNKSFPWAFIVYLVKPVWLSYYNSRVLVAFVCSLHSNEDITIEALRLVTIARHSQALCSYDLKWLSANSGGILPI